MFLFCLVFAMFCARLFICALWSPAGKGLTSWLSFVVSSVSLSLSHWYPGSGVVLDCIDSWSLHHYLLLELECSSILDIYLRHCFKIVFEIFHVIGRRPLFQINYILILIDYNSIDAHTQLFQPHWIILGVSHQPFENKWSKGHYSEVLVHI